ncbi:MULTISPECIES: hypothetical protein [unclassified Bacillus cereus group]|uniref:hypothetical protein n=1 Tax=unclassified Bacillus cereus group TaxID=2750818 RepID=UPI001F598905
MDFILNKKLAEDMSPYYDEMLRALAASLSHTLNFYRAFSKHPTILSCRILDNNELEIMLSKGLGQYIDPYTKNQVTTQLLQIKRQAKYMFPIRKHEKKILQSEKESISNREILL